jgi:cyclophilin family peptidyl-prolyl cis-trans isomerase
MRGFLSVALVICVALLAPAFAQDAKNARVVIDTSLGKITIELNAEKAPISVKNFLQYVDDKHYDGAIFHRVIADFMIQGGGFDQDKKEAKTREPIKNEADNGLSNVRGTIAMARTADPDSATAQFFINTVDNKRLDKSDDSAGYAVFGKVTAGMEVVDKIRRADIVDQGGAFTNLPSPVIVIRSVRRAK